MIFLFTQIIFSVAKLMEYTTSRVLHTYVPNIEEYSHKEIGLTKFLQQTSMRTLITN